MTSTQKYQAFDAMPSFPSLKSASASVTTVKGSLDATHAHEYEQDLTRKEIHIVHNTGSRASVESKYGEEQLKQLQEEIARLRNEEYRLKLKEQVIKSDISDIRRKLQGWCEQ